MVRVVQVMGMLRMRLMVRTELMVALYRGPSTVKTDWLGVYADMLKVCQKQEQSFAKYTNIDIPCDQAADAAEKGHLLYLTLWVMKVEGPMVSQS